MSRNLVQILEVDEEEKKQQQQQSTEVRGRLNRKSKEAVPGEGTTLSFL